MSQATLTQLEEDDEEESLICKQEEQRWRGSKKEVRTKVEELIEEFPREDRIRMRRQYLESQKEILERVLGGVYQKWYESWKKDESRLVRILYADNIEAVTGKLKRIKNEIRFLDIDPENKNEITDEQIARARDYPVTELVEVNRAGMAQCIEHDDKRPSMYCKNNFLYCFTCNWSGDAIDLVMKRDSLSFREAIAKLT